MGVACQLASVRAYGRLGLAEAMDYEGRYGDDDDEEEEEVVSQLARPSPLFPWSRRRKVVYEAKNSQEGQVSHWYNAG